MNPLNNSLNRIGFLVWSIIIALYVAGFGVLIDKTKMHHVGLYWLPLRLVWAALLLTVCLLVIYRRLQNAGLSKWLILLSVVPYLGELFWFVLLFIPPKKSRQS